MTALDEKIQPARTELVEHREYDTSIISPGSPVDEEAMPRLNWQIWMAIVVSVIPLIPRNNHTNANLGTYIPIQFIPLHALHASCSPRIYQRRSRTR